MAKYRVQHRRGTSSQWVNSDIVLYDGEIAIEDTGDGYRGLIIGDGVHTYVDLPKLYLRETKTRVVSINLPVDNWNDEGSSYYQVVEIDNITSKSKIDLQPSAELIEQLQNDEVALMTANDNGTVTVYAIGKKPTVTYEIQATIAELA